MKVSGHSITFQVLEQRLKDLGKLPHGCDMIALDHGYLVVRFFSREDYLKVLTQGPWIILGHYLTVTLVCVPFSEMHIEFFNKKVLLRMGNQIGKVTKVDDATVSVLRGCFARLCVETDLNKPLLPSYVS